METEAKEKKYVSAFTLFTKSKNLVLQNINVFGALYLIPFIFNLLPSLTDNSSDADRTSSLFNGLSGTGFVAVAGFGIVFAVISIIISFIIQTMLFAAELEVSEDKKPSLRPLFDVAKKYWLRIAGLSIVTALLFVGGLILFIVPGLIVIRRYFLASYYLIDKDLSIGEAMRQSAADSKQAAGSIWGVIGVSFLLALTAIVPLIGWLVAFVLTALYSVAPALRYKEILANRS
jgi:hypothetical protein